MRVELILEAVDRASGVVEKVRGAVEKINTSMAQVATVEKVEAAQKRASAAQSEAQSNLLGTMATAAAVTAPIKKAVTAWNTYEDVLTDIGLKADVSGKKLSELGERVRAQARVLNTSSTDMLKGFDQLMAGGLAVDIAEKITGPLAKTAIATKAKFDDLSQTAVSLVNNLKVIPDEVTRALDVMNQAGKDGQFELKNMAQFFPKIGAQYATMGQTGVKAVADLAAMLQVMRMNVGTSGEAVTNLYDLLYKFTADPAINRFGELGLDGDKIKKRMAEAQKLGTIMETMHDILQEATKGDLSKIKDIFSDKQALGGAQALMQHWQKFLEIREKALGAEGSVDRDFATRMGLGVEKTRALTVAMAELATTIGQIFAPSLAETLERLTNLAWAANEWAKANPELALSIGKVALAVTSLLVGMAALKLVGAVLKTGLITIIGLFWKFNAAGRNVALLAVLFRGLAFAVRLALSPLSMVARFLFGVGAGFMAAAAAAGGWKVILAALGARALALATGGLVALKGAIMGIGAALLANPLGIMAMGIAAVAAGAYLVYRNWATIGPMLAKLWADMKAAAEAGWNALVETAGSLATRLGTALKAAWDGAAGWVSAGVQAAIQTIKDLLDPVVKWIDEWGEKLSNVFKKVFGGIGDLVSGAIDRISAGLGKVGDLLSDASDWAFGTRTPKIIDPEKIQKSIDKAREYEAAIKAIAPAAQQAVAQANAVLAAADFTSHGVRMMTTLAAGIRQGSQAAVAAVRETVQKIRDHLPHSPAKTGPLSDLDQVRFFETVAGAVKRGAPAAVDAVRAGTNQMAAALGGSGGGALAGAGAGAAGGAITVNLTYNPSISATGGEGDVVEQIRKSAYEITEIIKGELGRRKRLEY